MSKLDINGNVWRFLKPEKAEAYAGVYAETHSGAYRPLAPLTTRRQFATAREILNRMNSGQRGVLLADDVGLGKTTVAALVALVFAGSNQRVRILAPNETMTRRWRQELEAHRAPLSSFASHLTLDAALRRTAGKVHRLRSGSIQVTTHGKADQLACDLLIVDEVHRTRSQHSPLARALRKSRQDIGRVLVLTATPFSIDPNDLARLLTRVGGHKATGPMRKFASMLDELWKGKRSGTPEMLASQLEEVARLAIEAIRPFVIRHSIADLSEDEQKAFGVVAENWAPLDADPSPKLIEAMLRTDRAIALGKKSGGWTKVRTNDPRHHVGSHQIHSDLDELLAAVDVEHEHHEPARVHAAKAKTLLRSNGRHPKVRATVEHVAKIVSEGEKVLVFCDHHAVATELAAAIADDLQWAEAPYCPPKKVWREAWEEVFENQPIYQGEESEKDSARYDRFVNWLSSDGMRAQVFSWLEVESMPSATQLAGLLQRYYARGSEHCRGIDEAIIELYAQLTDEESTSTRSILSNKNSRGLPGASLARVAAACRPDDYDDAYPGVFFPREPDAALAVFNSPFGPDVLVATDKLSEGIDLHRCCRHLIHHELDPSPVRTVQRNGRIRRVNSWASITEQPIHIAYPALKGTRDEKLVKIMRSRLLQFDLLLGGVRVEIDLDEESGETSDMEAVLARAKKALDTLRLGL